MSKGRIYGDTARALQLLARVGLKLDRSATADDALTLACMGMGIDAEGDAMVLANEIVYRHRCQMQAAERPLMFDPLPDAVKLDL